MQQAAATLTRLRAGLALLAALAIASPRAEAQATSPPPPRAEIVEYGEYQTAPRAHLESAPDTAAGVIGRSDGSGPSVLLARTAEIAAAEGVAFGIMVGVPGLATDQTLPVTVRLDHPPITAPDGRVWRTETFPAELSAKPGLLSFCFEERWELVPGEWTYTLLHEGRPIASQRFTITLDPTRTVPSPCGGVGATVS